MQELEKLGIAWTVENPTNSIFWLTSWMSKLIEALGSSCSKVHFQMCMHGGRRPKKTTFLCGSVASFASLGILCNGKCNHLPWKLANGGMATAEERRYPLLLCQRYAKIVKKRFLPPTPKPELEFSSVRVHVETQPRRGLQELVSELKEVVWVNIDSTDKAVAERCLADAKVKAVIKG